MALAASLAAGSGASAQTAAAAGASTPPAVSAPASGDSGALAEIVVTARRRSESIQTAPVAVTALGGAALAQKNIVNVADLGTISAGLNIRRASNTPNSAVISIRGQVQSEPNITSDPSVGVYIGDMYVARAYGVLGDLLDVERVEVLRGPQGSLFGRNTIGGAIRILPVQADVDSGFTGFIAGGYGNFDMRTVSGAVTVPLVENHLAIRYAGSYNARDGYTKGYLITEPNLTPTDSVRMNDYSRQSHRLSLAWRPTDSVRVNVSGYLYRSTDHGSLVANIKGDVESTQITSLSPFAYSQSFRNSDQRAADFYSVLIPRLPSGFNLTKYVQGTGEYDISDNVTAKVVLSYLRTKADAVNQNTSGIVTDSIALVEFTPTNYQRQHQKTAELQFLGNNFGGRLNWILGAYYFKEKGAEINTGITKVFGNPITSTDFDAQAANESKSLFAYGDFDVTSRFSITLGGRYTWDTKSLIGRNRGTLTRVCVYGAGQNIITSTTPDGPCELNRTDDFNYFTYDVGANYKLTPNIFLYAKTNVGYRSGGQQPRAVNFASSTAFEPDKATNYEAGIKADLLNRHLRVNASGYHVDYSSVQQQVILSPPVVPTTTTQIVNLGNAKINGFEIETTARPLPGLTLDGNLAYVKVKYDNPETVQRFSPKWQYTLGGTYEFKLGDDASLRAHLDYSHITSFYLAQARADPTLPGYGLLNGRLTYELKSYSLSLFMNNITDKKYYSSGIVSSALVPATVGEPRMYGFELRYNF
jgi:iron complex outermembrane receptor protein